MLPIRRFILFASTLALLSLGLFSQLAPLTSEGASVPTPLPRPDSHVADTVDLVRGPYLQLATPHSVLIRWRTDAPSTGAVRFGTSLNALTDIITSTSLLTDHVFALTSLAPASTYFYSVGTLDEDLSGPDQTQYFNTAPIPGERAPTRIWVLGDSGYPPVAQRTRDAYLNYIGGQHTDLALLLGDISYERGTDEEFQKDLFDVFGNVMKQTVFWPTPGNHDVFSADAATQTGPYYEVFSLPKQAEAGGAPSGTEAYYSFDYGNIHFISLDSENSIWWPLGPQPMIDWLYQDLQTTDQDWIIAFLHHPPYSKGRHDSDTEGNSIRIRERFLPLLEDAGVDLVLSGHSHSYERSFLLDGHYGTSDTLEPWMILNRGSGNPVKDEPYRKEVGPHKGAVYVVAGSSSKLASGPFNHPVMYTSFLKHGSVVIDAIDNELRVTFIDFNGVVNDYFVIKKNLPSNPTPSPTPTSEPTPTPTTDPPTYIYLPLMDLH